MFWSESEGIGFRLLKDNLIDLAHLADLFGGVLEIRTKITWFYFDKDDMMS
jgi:hypothetical protein